jgi:hypothetical protein
MKYRVWLRSVPGQFEQYDGKVDVTADNDEAAIKAAFDKLQRTAFPDRSRADWRVYRVERLLYPVIPAHASFEVIEVCLAVARDAIRLRRDGVEHFPIDAQEPKHEHRPGLAGRPPNA